MREEKKGVDWNGMRGPVELYESEDEKKRREDETYGWEE